MDCYSRIREDVICGDKIYDDYDDDEEVYEDFMEMKEMIVMDMTVRIGSIIIVNILVFCGCCCIGLLFILYSIIYQKLKLTSRK